MTYTVADIKPIPQSDLAGIPLLRERWDLAKADQSAWGQGDWIHSGGHRLDPAVRDYITANRVPPWNCGTKYCVAGHIALAKGATLTAEALGWFDIYGFDQPLTTTAVIAPDGHRWSVSDYAQDLIGLSDVQTVLLFDSGNSADLIEAFVCALEADPEADLHDVADHYYDVCCGVDPDEPDSPDNCRYCVAEQASELSVGTP